MSRFTPSKSAASLVELDISVSKLNPSEQLELAKNRNVRMTAEPNLEAPAEFCNISAVLLFCIPSANFFTIGGKLHLVVEHSQLQSRRVVALIHSGANKQKVTRVKFQPVVCSTCDIVFCVFVFHGD